MPLIAVLGALGDDALDGGGEAHAGEAVVLNQVLGQRRLARAPRACEGNPHPTPPLETDPPLYPPPRRLVPADLQTGLECPAGQRPLHAHSQATLRCHAGCRITEADEGDADVASARSATLATIPCPLSRSSVASTMSST